MSIESHCTANCNITTNIYVTTYHSLCVVNLLLVAQNGLSRNGLIEPIEPHLFRENSSGRHGCIQVGLGGDITSVKLFSFL